MSKYKKEEREVNQKMARTDRRSQSAGLKNREGWETPRK